MKSFKFTYDGSNPFGAKKSIKATLSIFSNSFDELMIERRSPTGTRDKYRLGYAIRARGSQNWDVSDGYISRHDDNLIAAAIQLISNIF